MSRIVLDSSALLAVLNREVGADKLPPELLSAATCSTVNLAEVHSKLIARGFTEGDAWKAALYPIGERADFTLDHAQVAGNLICPNALLRPVFGRPGVFSPGSGVGCPRLYGR